MKNILKIKTFKSHTIIFKFIIQTEIYKKLHILKVVGGVARLLTVWIGLFGISYWQPKSGSSLTQHSLHSRVFHRHHV